MARRNLTNQRFGKLVALGDADRVENFGGSRIWCKQI